MRLSPSAASASMTGRIRACSSAAATGVAPGRVDSPPTSMISAPSATIRRAWSSACSGSANSPPSEKLSGVTLTMPIRIDLGPRSRCRPWASCQRVMSGVRRRCREPIACWHSRGLTRSSPPVRAGLDTIPREIVDTLTIAIVDPPPRPLTSEHPHADRRNPQIRHRGRGDPARGRAAAAVPGQARRGRGRDREPLRRALCRRDHRASWTT